MPKLVWDETGKRTYETGINQGVLYIPNSAGIYSNGVAWNGLVSVSENPSGAEPNAQYADNIKYLNLMSAEEFSATIEAFTYPDEFAQFDGLNTSVEGVYIGQQPRKTFGLSYRTLIGNDTSGEDYGYKIHLVYGCMASPSQKDYNTVNDSPEAITFSWEVSTTPVAVTGMKPTAHITIDSTKVNSTSLEALELMLYGDVSVDPILPTPDAVISMFDGDVTLVTPLEPDFDEMENKITIPNVTGVVYMIDNQEIPAGDVIITENTIVVAYPKNGYAFNQGYDNDWFYEFQQL